MKIINLLLPAVFYLINCPCTAGQDPSKDLTSETTQDLKATNTYVYLHTDRSYYLPGESVFFKAYFLDDLNNRSFPVNDTLQVVLLDQYGLVVATGRFPVNNNLLSGNIELPDFLTEGNYILIASTRSMNKLPPEKMFSRIIEIRKSLENYLITYLSLTDTLYESGDMLTAQIRFAGKDNKPVPASFAYQLTDKTGDIINGNNKADKEGLYSLKLKLPRFDNKDTLKLLVVPSYKGTKNVTGIVIPTRSDYTGKRIPPQKNLLPDEFKHLKIGIKTVNLSKEQKNEVGLDISVTDNKGAPVMASLSVSVSNIVPNQPLSENDNILNYIKLKNGKTADNTSPDIKKYFTQKLIHLTRYPGSQYVVQIKNNPKKLLKKEMFANQKNQAGYSSDRNIMDILMSIKPYHLENGKIIFGTSSLNSINSQDGALIVVDGIKMGTDVSILKNIPVQDIARITASTNVMDIQRYSALNNEGIIEIFTKKSNAYLKNEKAQGKTKSSTLFWGPDIMTNSSGIASATFLYNENPAEILISVEGMAANGLCGSSSIQYKVK